MKMKTLIQTNVVVERIHEISYTLQFKFQRPFPFLVGNYMLNFFY